MSDERLLSPGLTDDAVDGSAPTEREPSLTPAPAPSSSPARGAALSVLWWPESQDEDDEPQKPETD
jgi:hypothetical protein